MRIKSDANKLEGRIGASNSDGATMDSNSNSPAPQTGGATGSSSGVGPDSNANPDWRLQPDARQRIVNKIMDTLKRHIPVPVPEGINELQKFAVRLEEKIYSAATSQPDYIRKISLKMISMENKQPGLNSSIPNQNRMDLEGPVHNTMKTRKCRICEDCVHKRRNLN